MLIMLVKSLIMLGFILLNVVLFVWLERKVQAHMQFRLGPMRTGWHGLLQTFADLIKLISKEEIIPEGVDRLVFRAAPLIVFVPSFMLLVTIPFGSGLVVRNLDLGIFYLLALSTLNTLGIVIAGWSSHNKYSLIGGLRSAGQLISYELPLGLAAIAVVMLVGSLRLNSIVEAQSGTFFGFIPRWFAVLQPVGFIVFLTCTMAELSRAPFDLPEAESEIVAGYFTEYTGIGFGMFFLAEYANLWTMCAICVLLFLGGWQGPSFLPPVIWFLTKTYALVFVLMWIRATWPRVRGDQLMNIGWKVLLPLALLNVLVTGVLIKAVKL